MVACVTIPEQDASKLPGEETGRLLIVTPLMGLIGASTAARVTATVTLRDPMKVLLMNNGGVQVSPLLFLAIPNISGLQTEHREALTLENRFEGQPMHPEVDSYGLKVPGWQSEQIPAPDEDMVPAGQL